VSMCVYFARANLRGSDNVKDQRKLQVCSIDNITFEGDCNYSQMRKAASTCTDIEFFSLLGVDDETEATSKVNDICLEAERASTEGFFPWSSVTKRGYQFDKEFFNGGTIFNEEYATVDSPNKLQRDTARLKLVEDHVLSKRGISWPENISNFSTESSCDSRAAMCCWVADRDSVGSGTCSGFGCQDESPDGNTDVCYVDMANSQLASHVKDGYAIFPKAFEGEVTCHGFAWSDDTADYKGNLLFKVAMADGLMGNGYVRNVPGAPMCGCVEQMPVVSHSDCTDITVKKTWQVKNASSEVYIELYDTDIQFSDCKDLVTTHSTKNNPGVDISKHITGECGTVVEEKIETEFNIEKDPEVWIPVTGKGIYYLEEVSSDEFRKIWSGSANQILRRRCVDCNNSHKDIYYRRFDTNGLPEDFDLLHVVKDYWHSSPSIEHNDFQVDFKLYSTYEDAKNDVNNWQACNFNDANVGFPRDCGPTKLVGHQWNTFSMPTRGRHHGQPSVSFYVEG